MSSDVLDETIDHEGDDGQTIEQRENDDPRGDFPLPFKEVVQIAQLPIQLIKHLRLLFLLLQGGGNKDLSKYF